MKPFDQMLRILNAIRLRHDLELGIEFLNLFAQREPGVNHHVIRHPMFLDVRDQVFG